MNKVLLSILVLLSFAVTAPVANAKKKKSEESYPIVKVWFKNGTVYEGPMVKHWQTYRQTFLGSGHNFHILPEGTEKSIKHEAYDTDSILIVNSTDDKWFNGAVYVPLSLNVIAKRTTGKMLLRTWQGRNVEMCKLPYVGNCMMGLRNIDQWMEYWMVRFPETGEAFSFYDNTLQKGCHKPKQLIDQFISNIEKSYPNLAQAVKEKFAPDKKTKKEMNKILLENPEEFVVFIDNYLTSNPK